MKQMVKITKWTMGIHKRERLCQVIWQQTIVVGRKESKPLFLHRCTKWWCLCLNKTQLCPLSSQAPKEWLVFQKTSKDLLQTALTLITWVTPCHPQPCLNCCANNSINNNSLTLTTSIIHNQAAKSNRSLHRIKHTSLWVPDSQAHNHRCIEETVSQTIAPASHPWWI
jgi:hypothetical protein